MPNGAEYVVAFDSATVFELDSTVFRNYLQTSPILMQHILEKLFTDKNHLQQMLAYLK